MSASRAAGAGRHLPATGRATASVPEVFARLTDELPDVEPVVPVVFLDDELLPDAMVPVEPVAFALECALSAWGPRGPHN